MSAQRPWALVTGASSGLGVDFALQLAGRGWNLVLTARRRDRMEALAERLRTEHQAEVLVIAGDLGDATFREQLVREATAGRQLTAVVNNAGFGLQGGFLDVDWSDWARLMNLNMVALTELSWRLGKHMRDHGRPAHLVNIASIGAYQPVPTFAVYAASKSYVRDMTEAVAFELAGTNVAVTCVCPGGTRTEFMETAGLKLGGLAAATLQSSESCVREALTATLARRTLVVTGWMNKLMTFMTRLAPRWLSASLAERSMRPPS